MQHWIWKEEKLLISSNKDEFSSNKLREKKIVTLFRASSLKHFKEERVSKKKAAGRDAGNVQKRYVISEIVESPFDNFNFVALFVDHMRNKRIPAFEINLSLFLGRNQHGVATSILPLSRRKARSKLYEKF